MRCNLCGIHTALPILVPFVRGGFCALCANDWEVMPNHEKLEVIRKTEVQRELPLLPSKARR